MELNHIALDVIVNVAARLDLLFREYGFQTKVRETDSNTFTEKLGYEKGNLLFEITVSLHPHDYPNPIHVSLITKSEKGWQVLTNQQLLKLIGHSKANGNEALLIFPLSRLNETIEKLYEVCNETLAKKST